MSTVPRAIVITAAAVGLLLALMLAADLRATQQALMRQLQARNQDSAAVLAAALSLPGQDEAAWRGIAAAQFAAGHTLHLRLQAADRSAVELRRAPSRTSSPAWFRTLLPLAAAPVTLPLGEGARPAGALQLESDPAWAQDLLWASFLRTGLAAAALALLSSWALIRALTRRETTTPSADTLWAPASVAVGQGPQAEGPGEHAWHEAYAAQAEQVAHLQRQAQLDDVTGLPLRSHFLSQVQQRLDEPGGPALALLIVRVLELEAINLRLGHEATDRLLGAVADVLLTYVDRVPSMLAGRLNGTDFALCLPVAGVAAETAASLRNALSAAPALRAGQAEVAVGGVEGVQATSAGDALATADAALARAEAGGDPAAACVVLQAAAQDEVLGAGAWRERIRKALVEGRTQLRWHPAVDAQGRLQHLECALQVQLRHGGAFEPAERWRAAARRGRLLSQVDLTAVERTVEAIARDDRAHAVQISRSSLGAAGFTNDVIAALAAAPPGTARQLGLELVNDTRHGAATAPLVAALSAWTLAGMRVGLDCSAGAPPELPDFRAAGLHYVRVDASQLQGLAHDDAVRSYARGLVALVHDLGLGFVVSDVRDAADAAALWALGVDAASGPALATTPPSGSR